MSDEIYTLEREWLEADREVKRLRAAMADAWEADDRDLLDRLRTERASASALRKAVNAQMREIVETSGLALTAAQVSAARSLIGWKFETLAERSKIATPTLWRAEKDGTAHMRPIKMVGLRRAFEAAGVEFIAEDGGPGVRLRKAAS
jgi:hypothetical protein